jgi:transketolase
MRDLQTHATEIRRIAVSLIHGAGSGHPGSCLSAADLIAALYFREMRLDDGTAQAAPYEDVAGGASGSYVGQAERGPERRADHRDRFVLSKGHACPALYAALHLRGFFDRAALGSFRRLGGLLQGSPTTSVPGVDATCGSLGQGFSIAIGLALGLQKRPPGARPVVAEPQVSDTMVDEPQPARVYVMLGDGELQEGQIWEGAMAAGHYKLGNLCAIVDYNKMQSDDFNERIMRLEPLGAKWRAFNWSVRAIDGHNFDEIAAAFVAARAESDKPTMIIAHTTKGKGVSYMEGVPSWHGSVTMKPEEIRQALADLGVPQDRQAEYAFHG